MNEIAKILFDEGGKYGKREMNVFAKTYIKIDTGGGKTVIKTVFEGRIEDLIKKLEE